MKNIEFIFLSLLMLTLAACGTQNNFGSGGDDVYWSQRDDDKRALTVEELERREKKQSGIPQGLYEPVDQNPVSEPSGYDQSRAQTAYESWNKQRGQNNSSGNNNNNTNNYTSPQYTNDPYYNASSVQVTRGFYNDPWFNSLSIGYVYAPVVPVYYGPAWSFGFGYSSFGGWGSGFNYGMGWGYPYGMGWGNPYGMGLYDPFYGPFYSPWVNPYYGFGYNRFCSPFYGCGYPYGYGNGRFYGDGGYYRQGGNSNPPRRQPRDPMGSGMPANSQPRNSSPEIRASRPVNEINQPTPNRDNQPARVRPAQPADRYTPVRGSNAGSSTTNPGSNNVPNQGNRPVEIVPERNSNQPNQPVYSTRPGGELVPGPNNTRIYVPSRSSNTYQDNNAGEYRPVNRGRNNNMNNPPPARYQVPNQAPSRSTEPKYNNPSRNNPPVYQAPSRPDNSPAPNYSTPPAGRPSGGGSGSGGGGRTRPR